MKKFMSAISTVFVCRLLAIVSADCYNFDGTLRFPSNDTTYVECNTDGGDVMCCGNYNGDKCRSDGLCTDTAGRLWRESCGDQTWENSACLKLCVDGVGDEGLRNSTDVRVTECPDRSICCGADNTTCCDEGNGQFILSDRSLVDTKPSSTTLPTIITVTPSPNLNDTSNLQQDSSEDSNKPVDKPASDGSNTAAIAGGAVGGVAAIALVIGGILLFVRRRKSTKGVNENFTLVIPDQKVGDWAMEEVSDSRQEVDGQAVSELAAKATSPVEMDGTPASAHEIRVLDEGKGRAV